MNTSPIITRDISDVFVLLSFVVTINSLIRKRVSHDKVFCINVIEVKLVLLALPHTSTQYNRYGFKKV